ncbi:MAG: hypothetical protein D6812_13920 [Deltaproteobacteria bacterium]|nr:MAG: hypothetical protein D6812_13920 [Deltaproteobacteria bacterium]
MKRTKFWWALIASISIFFSACDTVPPDPAGERIEVGQGAEEPLPAILSEAEKALVAESRVSPRIYRYRHPEIYGFTPPPENPVRRFGEFEPVDALFLAYTGWISMDPLYGDLLEGVYRSARVEVLVETAQQKDLLYDLLRRRGIPRDGVEVIEGIPYDSMWMRDYGPQAVIEGEGDVAYIDTRYYIPRVEDDAVPTLLSEEEGNLAVYRPDLWSEGGNFFANGEGICFTTNYLAEQNGGSKEEVAAILHDYFGCEETHFLRQLEGNVIAHIDMFFYLAAPDTILLGEYTPEQDPKNYEILEEDYALLSRLTTRDGSPFTIIRVPMPSHIKVPVPGATLPVIRTYMNMVAVNDVVLVPVYLQEPEREAEALDIIQSAFPDRRIVPIPSDLIARLYGAIHCITQTTPRLQ